MWPAETVSFHVSAAKIYDFSNRTPCVSVWSLGFCSGNQETVEFPVPCGLGAGRRCSPYMFLALGHLKKKQKKQTGWATVSRSAGGGELCLCLTSMHLRLEEAHHTDFLWHPKKRSSGSFLPSPHWCFSPSAWMQRPSATSDCSSAHPAVHTHPGLQKDTFVYLKCSVWAFFANVFVLLRRWNRGSIRLLRPPVVIATLQLDAARDFRDLKPSLPFFILNGSKIWWLGSQKSTCVCSKLLKVKLKLFFLR